MSSKGPSNSQKMQINLNAFDGGQSIDFKNAIQNGFYDEVALDFRKKSSQMSVLPRMDTVSTNFIDLPVNMVQDPTGMRWIIGDQGNLYKFDSTTNTVTKVATLSSPSGHGLVYEQLSDMLYITGQQTVSMYGPLNSTLTSPTFYSDQFAQSASVANGVVNLFNPADGTYDGLSRNSAQNVGLAQGITSNSQITATNATNNYTLPNTISETTGQFCVFAPDLEPFYSIQVKVGANKGTGNWTLTLHNGLNQVVGAVTVLNSAITINTYVEFKFPAPGIRSFTGALQSGLSAAYHFHLTSSVASDTAVAKVIVASDLTGCDFLLFNQRMVLTQNTWHPLAIFAGTQVFLCVGNGQYLSTYTFANNQNPSNNMWQRERFPLDAGYEVCGLSVNNQYLVIAAEKRSNAATNNNYQDGMLYFWDGINATYNFKIQIPMGPPYALNTINNISYFECAGSLYAWGGGQQVIKVRPIAYQNTDYLGTVDVTYTNPNMLDSRYNLLMIGFPSSTTNTTIRSGIYTWGSVELIYPNSFGYSYQLANGQVLNTGSNNLRLGMVRNFVDTLYMSWSYFNGTSTVYGLDMTNSISKPARKFSWDSLIWDGGSRWKAKQALRLKITFLPLPTGTTITARYSLDRGSWISADAAPFKATGGVATPDGASTPTEIVVEINNARFHEFQFGLDGTCDDTNLLPPIITDCVFEVDPLSSEVDLTKDG